MQGMLLLAWRYLTYMKVRTSLLLAALALTMTLPLATRWTIERFEAGATRRAAATPMVIGSKGSRFSLAIHALHFQGETPPTLPRATLSKIEAYQLAHAIPLFIKFKAQGFPIVGTTDEYFTFRELTLSNGEPLDRLGDCLLGANVAKSLGLNAGDHVLSEPENAFDIAGPSPLSMRIRGVLQSTGTSDDNAIFCRLKTSWIIEGLGHGHFEQASEANADDVSNDSQSDIRSHKHSAGRENLAQYAEVTDENVKSFHFHGALDEFPLTAIIAIPDSEKSATILSGKFLEADEPNQIVRPIDVIEELMQLISQVRKLFDLGSLAMAVVAVVLLSLVVMLSVRLRQREMRTLNWLGCSRGTIAAIMLTELSIVVVFSLAVAVPLALWISFGAEWFITENL